MKTKTILISLGIILLLGSLVYAGLSLSSSVTIDKTLNDELKSRYKDTSITSTPIVCDSLTCYSHLKGQFLDMDFKTSRYICSERDKTKECISIRERTEEELLIARDSFIKKQVEDYATQLIQDKSKAGFIEKVGGGTITIDSIK